MNLREAAQQALDELIAADGMPICNETDILDLSKTIDALRAALAEEAMQRLTDVQQEMVGPSIKETRHHKANRMLKEAMDSDRENIIRNMPDFEFDFSTESQKRKPLTDEEIDRVWRSVDYKISYDNFRLAIARAIERAHGIGGEE
ncbi:MAG: hypothetical protein EHM17_16565 [Verrucomicrobiaceae bacterium]|nr:MAG: hypothetical protein EHM17_17610 [Verrucomicrobiaceae bacterium]RPJ30548.1 MAG: hypothetical protein EHM17_16565 [Verrucomicrobiaceae bacterium]